MTEHSQTEQKNLEAVVSKIQRLLNAKGRSEEETAAFAAKAQELMVAYNIDMLTVEQGGDTGKREEQRMNGGMYVYERELWSAIAQLNWCVYFTLRVKATHKRRKISFSHRIVGRVVNVAGTRMMAGYLQSAIERLCRERFPDAKQFFSREAVAFREGMSDNFKYRLWERRQELVDEEERKAAEAAHRAAEAGTSNSFALTLATVEKNEEAGNYDFLHGEGAWARKQALRAEWNKEIAEERAAQAKADSEAEAAYAAWAAANPEEARKEEEKAAKAAKREEERQAKREANRRGRWSAPTARERRQNSDYYDDGYRKAKDISLEPQIDSRSNQKKIGKG